MMNAIIPKPEGEELLAKFGRLEDAPYYFRAHHLLCNGNLHGTYKWGSTNVYIEDDDDWDITEQSEVNLIIDGLTNGQEYNVTHYRIDSEHSNAYIGVEYTYSIHNFRGDPAWSPVNLLKEKKRVARNVNKGKKYIVITDMNFLLQIKLPCVSSKITLDKSR